MEFKLSFIEKTLLATTGLSMFAVPFIASKGDYKEAMLFALTALLSTGYLVFKPQNLEY